MRIDESVACRSFYRPGSGAEHFISITAPQKLTLAKQIEYIVERYSEARRTLSLDPETAIFRRIFVSDILNQAAAVRSSRLVDNPPDGPIAVSIVQQPPLRASKLALLAYHIDANSPVSKSRLSPKNILVEKNNVRHVWSTGLCSNESCSPTSAIAQTREIFGALINTLSSCGGTLCDNCIRTWVYLKDVDVFYRAMVDSRRELFRHEGLTENTHYIASTGIEGACAHQFDLVALDAYSVIDLIPEQISYLNDFNRLCATKDYNVTFERGTRISYADRSHCYISGTASIDRAGKVVHPGNVLSQLDHTLANVEALLRSGSASLQDLMYLLVYLRDPTDFTLIDGYLSDRFPDLPTIIVQAAVCRPDWLIEVEGIAVAANDEPAMPSF
jgi:enamine deaminase RidA (YjgF/YER057c/UK114 family)